MQLTDISTLTSCLKRANLGYNLVLEPQSSTKSDLSAVTAD